MGVQNLIQILIPETIADVIFKRQDSEVRSVFPVERVRLCCPVSVVILCSDEFCDSFCSLKRL